MPLDAIRLPVQDDLTATDAFLTTQLASSSIPLINQLSEHVIQSGGKRLRPLLVLLGAKLFGYVGDIHIRLAAVIELIHTATLLHDDVVDASELRRGKQTANGIWGNEASILVGDYLYSRAFQIMVALDHMPIMGVLAKATNTIAEGEVLQLLNRHNTDATEATYMDIIRCKTGTLFEAAAQLGAVLCERPSTDITAMAHYGLHLGIAFQLIDDALDYTSTSAVIGKKIGDDLADGKMTLPLLRTLQQGTPSQISQIKAALIAKDPEPLSAVLAVIQATDAIDYTHQVAKHHVKLALEYLSTLPLSPAHDALRALAIFTVDRLY